MRETAEPVSRAAAEPEIVRGPPSEFAAPVAGVLALQRAAGNRATMHALGLARAQKATNVLPFDEDIFASKIGKEAATYGQMLFHSKLGDLVVPKAVAEDASHLRTIDSMAGSHGHERRARPTARQASAWRWPAR